MEDLKARIDELAELMDEFDLSKASLKGDGWAVSLSTEAPEQASAPQSSEKPRTTKRRAKAKQSGTPVTSPMTGVFYAAPNPQAEPFAPEGASVSQGQTVALIEAMKVFNEIPAPVSGTVSKIVAKSGALVGPGDVLLYIE